VIFILQKFVPGNHTAQGPVTEMIGSTNWENFDPKDKIFYNDEEQEEAA